MDGGRISGEQLGEVLKSKAPPKPDDGLGGGTFQAKIALLDRLLNGDSRVAAAATVAVFDEILKALHIVSVIAWMAGLLYLPRLFVYHADAPKGSPQSETFKIMERRLLRGIMNPAMIAVWVFGLAVAWQGDWWHAGWWQVKFGLAVGLTGVHHLYARWRKEFEADRNARPANYYRWWNEVPTVFMIAIVFLAVLKPF